MGNLINCGEKREKPYILKRIPGQKILLFLVGDFVEDYELMIPYQMALMSYGKNTPNPRVIVASPDKKYGAVIRTAIHENEGAQTYSEKRGHNFVINFSWEHLTYDIYSQFDGLYIPGGRSPEYIRLNSKALAITKWFMNNNKPVASICHGVQLLTAAKCLNGKKATGYFACEPEITNSGGFFQKCPANEAVVDGNLVTGVAWAGHPRVITEWFKLMNIEWVVDKIQEDLGNDNRLSAGGSRYTVGGSRYTASGGKQHRIMMIVGDYVEDYEAMNVYQMLLLGKCLEPTVICPDKWKNDYVETCVHDFEGDATYSEKQGHKFGINTDFARFFKPVIFVIVKKKVHR